MSNTSTRAASVTVVVPFYNRSRFLLRLIMSVKQQTMLPIRLLIIDNGSNFGEAQEAWNIIAAESLQTTMEILYLSTLKTGNANYARNLGLQLAKTEYVAFLDSDDWWEPNHLENSAAALHGSDRCAVYCGAIVHRERNSVEWSSDVNLSPSPFNFLFVAKQMAQTSSFVVRRAALPTDVWDLKLKRHQDYDFFLKIHYKKGGWLFNSWPSVNIDWREGGAAKIDFRSMIRFLKKWETQFELAAQKTYLVEQVRQCHSRKAHKMYYRYYRRRISILPSKLACPASIQSSSVYLTVRGRLKSCTKPIISYLSRSWHT